MKVQILLMIASVVLFVLVLYLSYCCITTYKLWINLAMIGSTIGFYLLAYRFFFGRSKKNVSLGLPNLFKLIASIFFINFSYIFLLQDGLIGINIYTLCVIAICGLFILSSFIKYQEWKSID